MAEQTLAELREKLCTAFDKTIGTGDNYMGYDNYNAKQAAVHSYRAAAAMVQAIVAIDREQREAALNQPVQLDKSKLPSQVNG